MNRDGEKDRGTPRWSGRRGVQLLAALDDWRACTHHCACQRERFDRWKTRPEVEKRSRGRRGTGGGGETRGERGTRGEITRSVIHGSRSHREGGFREILVRFA